MNSCIDFSTIRGISHVIFFCLFPFQGIELFFYLPQEFLEQFRKSIPQFGAKDLLQFRADS